MINNTPISQIHIIQQHQAKHKRRLQRILQSRPIKTPYTFSNNFLHMLETKRVNHEKWKEFHRNREKEELLERNQRMFNKLIDITVSDGPYGQGKAMTASMVRKSAETSSAENSIQTSKQQQKQKHRQSRISTNSKFRSTSLHHNYQLENIRKSRLIDQENPKLAQRIMEKTGDLSYHKDQEEFRRTREIVHRLQKFQQIKRAIHNTRVKEFNYSEVKIRSKTLPANHKTILTTLQKLQKASQHKLQAEPPVGDEQPRKPSKKSKTFRANMKEDQRYRTIESIREQTENNASEEFQAHGRGGEGREVEEEGDSDRMMEKYLDAERTGK